MHEHLGRSMVDFIGVQTAYDTQLICHTPEAGKVFNDIKPNITLLGESKW